MEAIGLEPVVHHGGSAGSAALEWSQVTVIDDYQAFVTLLDHPRLFFLDLPIGARVDTVIDEAYVVMEPGDVVLDATGSYWGDTLRRFRRMRHRSLFYVDVALIGAFPGGTILAAGDEGGVDLAAPLLERLARPGGFVRAGGAGAAHYALMVQEAVATAFAHALSEAQQLLEAYPHQLEAGAIHSQLWPDPPAPGGQAAWMLDDAIRLEASVPLLAQGVMLEIGHALDEQRQVSPADRVGGFIHPDDVL
jgi:6-phosphogluconate dehydrogenase